ncbi:two-component system sensor histidine kinase NtrB [Hydrogenophaga laconesensis]|uniref:histidine kinase n=1 Tax=Hydrogenophaga laconesensis TaxID=1805971 RepID=A0ABU1V872_9BURK|nr:ATP-binding protein [Hydrogenophaga laconesensis]MDR7093664.1 two-component system sensor histidine kinase DctS [Hydrogenophaga laconesensis]
MPPPIPTPDVDTLDLDTRQASTLTRRALTWLVALLLLVVTSAVLMVVVLRGEEAQEADRRRTADAQWLDQSLRFHLRRLETDLGALAQQAQTGPPAPRPALGGPWWQQDGQIAFHGWVPAGATLPADTVARGQAPALQTMLDTTRSLQRAAYAGPLPSLSEAHAPWLWLAVPHFEQGRFVGDYVAAVPLDRLLADALPGWFLQDHRVALATDHAPMRPLDENTFMAPINLPGAQLQLEVQLLGNQALLAPRAFFAVAMVCLAGMLLALVRLWRDTARRQRTEARLQTQLALRSAMERSVPLGLCAWDRDGHLLHVNQAFGRLVGWSPSELLRLAATPGQPLPYWPAEQGDEFEQLRQGASDPDRQQAGRVLQLRHRDGQPIEVLAHSAPLVLAHGEVAGWIGSMLDITERQRVERLAARQQAQLEASGRLVAVGEVASTLAHELNQPLGALSSFATGLLNRVREQRIGFDDIVPVLERIEGLAEKTGRVIQRVNAFARRQEMTRQPLALTPFVARVAAGTDLPDGVRLAVDLPPGDGPVVPADAMLLEHALRNLIVNAGQWAPLHTPATTPDEPRVRVELVRSADASAAGIRVSDSGPGVPPEQVATVFDAFSSHRPGGMGMGLAICRSIVEAHHGRIEIARSPDLLGAQFTLWLPLNP